MFYGVSETKAMSAAEIEAARDICRYCSVRRECLAESVLTEEPNGVWAGFTAPERDRMIAMYDPARDGDPVKLQATTTAGRRALPAILDQFDRSAAALEAGVVFRPGATVTG